MEAVSKGDGSWDGLTTPKTRKGVFPHLSNSRSIEYCVFRNNDRTLRALSTFLASTFCKIPTTSISKSELRHPTITPGVEAVGASDGQKMRINPLPATMTLPLERSPPFELFTCRDVCRTRARMQVDLSRSHQCRRYYE
jgi:hypothetical protein